MARVVAISRDAAGGVGDRAEAALVVVRVPDDPTDRVRHRSDPTLRVVGKDERPGRGVGDLCDLVELEYLLAREGDGIAVAVRNHTDGCSVREAENPVEPLDGAVL